MIAPNAVINLGRKRVDMENTMESNTGRLAIIGIFSNSRSDCRRPAG